MVGGNRREFLKRAGAALLPIVAGSAHYPPPLAFIPYPDGIPPDSWKEYKKAFDRLNESIRPAQDEVTKFREILLKNPKLAMGLCISVTPPGEYRPRRPEEGIFHCTIPEDESAPADDRPHYQLPRLNKLIRACMDIEYLDRKHHPHAPSFDYRKLTEPFLTVVPNILFVINQKAVHDSLSVLLRNMIVSAVDLEHPETVPKERQRVSKGPPAQERTMEPQPPITTAITVKNPRRPEYQEEARTLVEMSRIPGTEAGRGR